MFFRLRGSFLWVFGYMLCLNCPLEASGGELRGRIVDENGLVVPGATLTLSGPGLAAPLAGTSDESGRINLLSVPPGTYKLKVEKVGYYAYVANAFDVRGPLDRVEVVLNHRQEFEETVNVVYSTPAIDPQETAAQRTLTAEEIIDVPYPASHDFRNSLSLMPGVIKDNRGRVHVNGAAENQASYSLDGFNLNNPVSGILDNRISIDAIRAERLDSSRYSAEYGKGSAGVVALETFRGDDRFRVSATNFFPSFDTSGGLEINDWNPRITISGPIMKGRAWYFNAMDLQYNLNVVPALPSNANRSRNWFGSDMTLLQINVTGRNLLSLGYLINFQNSNHYGLTPLDPLESTRSRRERFNFLSVKDQAYFSGGWVLESGVALNHLETKENPLGTAVYVIGPGGRSGNYFMRSLGSVERLQFLSTLVTPYWNWHGRHSFKFGVDANRIRYRQTVTRQDIRVMGTDGQLLRLVSYAGKPSFGRDSSEFSAFGQDRWYWREGLYVEAGARLDWDQILRQALVSPRISVTLSPKGLPNSKFSGGIGIFYDAVNLSILTRELDQDRIDTFYASDGAVLLGPVRSRYLANEGSLKAPSSLNWSLGWQQKIPRSFYLRTEFIRKTGQHGWSYDPYPSAPGENPPVNTYLLSSSGRDTYYNIEWTLTRTFRDKYPWLLSYARSQARSTAVIDFSTDNPVFGKQGDGPRDWDSPNRLISWGTYPVPRFSKYLLSYFLEWHSGFPFSTVEGTQQLIGLPNRGRFPDYFSLNLHCERRFKLWRTQWALRAGFNNLTGNSNPVVVNNIIDSPDYRHFSGGQGRVFTGRIRFLGRN
jgi:hypothetical protein